MKILVTSGGTRVPIDDVRYIGNSSTGRFGARIVDVLLPNHQIILLASQGSVEPSLIPSFPEKYHRLTYVTYDDYAKSLQEKVRESEVVFLSAAVSDFGLIKIDGKIELQDGLTLHLSPLPKLIKHVKDWNPNIFQVGFKLLSNVSKTELIETAFVKGRESRSDFTIANDLNTIRSGNHTVSVIWHRSSSLNECDVKEFRVRDLDETREMVNWIFNHIRSLPRKSNHE